MGVANSFLDRLWGSSLPHVVPSAEDVVLDLGNRLSDRNAKVQARVDACLDDLRKAEGAHGESGTLFKRLSNKKTLTAASWWLKEALNCVSRHYYLACEDLERDVRTGKASAKVIHASNLTKTKFVAALSHYIVDNFGDHKVACRLKSVLDLETDSEHLYVRGSCTWMRDIDWATICDSLAPRAERGDKKRKQSMERAKNKRQKKYDASEWVEIPGSFADEWFASLKRP